MKLMAFKNHFQTSGFLSLIPAIIGRIARAGQARAKALGIANNMEGDGFQKGGVLIVEKGGQLLSSIDYDFIS